ncbi:MAG: TetR/AcrR family transcriptional regulator [Lautropia sp.]
MTRRPPTKPRKHATQSRARATVDALIEATARILVKEGFDRASTNRIAQQAGVSIGSLYQYYPSKEALVVAVAERHQEELMRVVRQALAEAAGLPLEPAIRRLVTAAIEAHAIDPALHRVLAEQTPQVGRLGNVEAYNRESHALARACLETRRSELRAVDLDLAAFVFATSVEALTHTAVLSRPSALTGAAMETLIDEVARLMVRYLRD